MMFNRLFMIMILAGSYLNSSFQQLANAASNGSVADLQNLVKNAGGASKINWDAVDVHGNNILDYVYFGYYNNNKNVQNAIPNVIYLMSRHPAFINYQNKDYSYTPLMFVAQYGTKANLQSLVQHAGGTGNINWDTEDSHGNTVLDYAYINKNVQNAIPNVIYLMSQHPAFINYQNKDYSYTPLMFVAQYGTKANLQSLVQHAGGTGNINWDTEDSHGNTVLDYAYINKNVQNALANVIYLVGQSISFFNYENTEHSYTPLMFVAKYGTVADLQLLVKTVGGYITTSWGMKDHKGNTVLDYAYMNTNVQNAAENAAYLVQQNSAFSRRNQLLYMNKLMWAAQYGTVADLQSLVQAAGGGSKINWDAVDKNGRNVLDYAYINGSYNKWADGYIFDSQQAIANVIYLVGQNPAFINYQKQNYSYTPLMFVAQWGTVQDLQNLVAAAGNNITQNTWTYTDSNGNNVLDYAYINKPYNESEDGYIFDSKQAMENVIYLVGKHPVFINYQNKEYSYTPLMFVAEYGTVKDLQNLVQAAGGVTKINWDLKDSSKKTVFDYASMNRNIQNAAAIIDYLKQQNPAFSKKNGEGQSVVFMNKLMQSAQKGTVQDLQSLVQAVGGAINVNWLAVDSKGNNVLDYAYMNKIIVSHPAETARYYYGSVRHPYSSVVYSYGQAIANVIYLVSQYPAFINYQNKNAFFTPVMFVVQNGTVTDLQNLVKAAEKSIKINWNLKDSKGNNVLDYAKLNKTSKGMVQYVQTLM